jgi:hypothetical protein
VLMSWWREPEITTSMLPLTLISISSISTPKIEILDFLQTAYLLQGSLIFCTLGHILIAVHGLSLLSFSQMVSIIPSRLCCKHIRRWLVDPLWCVQRNLGLLAFGTLLLALSGFDGWTVSSSFFAC